MCLVFRVLLFLVGSRVFIEDFFDKVFKVVVINRYLGNMGICGFYVEEMVC